MCSSFEYSGFYISAYPIASSESKNGPSLTGVSPSGGNDHVTLSWFGKQKAREMKHDNKEIIAKINDKFMNRTVTIDDVKLNVLENAKYKEWINGELVVTRKTRYDILYILDEKTQNEMGAFKRDVLKEPPMKHDYHISFKYCWDMEDAQVQLEKGRSNIPIKIRLGAAYDD